MGADFRQKQEQEEQQQSEEEQKRLAELELIERYLRGDYEQK